MPVYSSILKPPAPYHAAGTKNNAEMDADLSDAAARVIGNLKQEDRPRFKARIEQYQSYDQLPQDLKDIIDGKSTELGGQAGGDANPPSGYTAKSEFAGILKGEKSGNA